MITDTNLPEVLKPVADHIGDAHLIAWDGCHKIYLALDEIEAKWFEENYAVVLRSEPQDMLDTLNDWWHESCFLRFVNGVRHNAENPNDGFVSIVEQGAEYQWEDEEED